MHHGPSSVVDANEHGTHQNCLLGMVSGVCLSMKHVQALFRRALVALTQHCPWEHVNS